MEKFIRRPREETRERFLKALDELDKKREGQPIKLTTQVLLHRVIKARRKRYQQQK